MARLIKATAAAEVISENFNIPLADLVDVMADIDWVEPEEPKKGEWEDKVDDMPLPKLDALIYHRCSNCKRWSIRIAKCSEYNFCPYCGADMRGKADEE